MLPPPGFPQRKFPQKTIVEEINVSLRNRPVNPSSGCLWCNGLITREGLQREATTPSERQQQRYVDEPTVVAPSVITLNATVASQATNDPTNHGNRTVRGWRRRTSVGL